MQTIRANEQRIKELFTELVSIDSISFSERNMADRLNEILRETGFEVMEVAPENFMEEMREMYMDF